MRRSISFAVLVICLSVGCQAQTLDGEQVLRKMLEAERKVAFTAHQVTTLRKPSMTSEQIIYRDGLKGMRMEYLEPPGLKGEIRADDGKEVFHYIPKEKIIRVLPSKMSAMEAWAGSIGKALERGLVVEVVGSDRIAGRSAYVVEVRPRPGHDFRRKFWIDKEKWVKLKTEEVGRDGTVFSTSYYKRIEFVKAIPAEKFRIAAPSGVKVVREQGPHRLLPIEKAKEIAGFKLLEPSYLPQGFKPVGAGVIPFRKGKIVVLRYTDGVTTLSIFQTPGETLSPKFLEKLHHGPVESKQGVYSWRKGQINLTIMGRLSSEEIRRVADSVK